MFRIAALVFTTFLVLFTLFYSNATYEQQQKMPAPVRAAANDVLFIIADLTNSANNSIFSKLRQGIRRTGSELKNAAGYTDKPVEGGILAMNQNLTGADYTSRLIPNSTFTRATLNDANFTKAYLDNSAFDSASLVDGRFNQTIMTRVSARGADFTGANFNDADMTGAMAQGAVFDRVNINVTLMSSAQFSGASFRDANISGSYGDKSIFFGADFSGANVANSDFTRATLDRALFLNAVLLDSHFERASLIDTDFSGADLSTATGLTQKQLDEACGDGMTRLPDGLTLMTCTDLAAARLAMKEGIQARESQSGNAQRR